MPVKGKISKRELHETLINEINEIGGIKDDITTLKNNLSGVIHIIRNVVINNTGWTLNNETKMFEYKYTSDKITEDSIVDIIIHLDSLKDSKTIKSVTQSFNGYILLYSNEIINVDITCDLKIMKGV